MGLWKKISEHHLVRTVICWFDDDAGGDRAAEMGAEGVDWVRVIPFLLLHLACVAVVWTGWSWVALGTAIALYVIRMLAVTGVYHRYFSHRTYKTSRVWQFISACVATSSVQKGPLWWASHHRHHHRFADTPEDIHSPAQQGFLWSHMGWILSPKYLATRHELVKDWSAFPELVFLNRFSILPPAVLFALLWLVGEILRVHWPTLGTSGLQMLAWGFCISTVVLFHATATINSLDHMAGTRRYNTKDQSRNNWLLALITLGEGWHNNHHYYPISARNGFYWWEYDVTYYWLRLLQGLGIIWDMRVVPREKRDSARLGRSEKLGGPVQPAGESDKA